MKTKEIAIEARDIETVLLEHGVENYTLPDDDAEATTALVTDVQEAALLNDKRVTYLSEL